MALCFGLWGGGVLTMFGSLVTVAFICFIDYYDDADSCRYGNVTIKY